MRKTDAIGNVAGFHVDRDPPGTPAGTRINARFLNDALNELLGVQEVMGVPESDGSLKYVAASIIGITKRYRHEVGEPFPLLGEVKAPAAFDPDDPEAFFPAVCLDDFDTVKTVAEANYPDLVPWARAQRLVHQVGNGAATTAYAVTQWAVATNVATLTFNNIAAVNDVLAGLVEDAAVHVDEYGGTGFSDWGQTITLGAAIGNIPAGTYAINTDVDAAARTVQFAVTAANGSGAVTATAEFYRHRIAGSTTTARLFSARGRALVGAGVGELVSGLRRRSYMQGHWHLLNGSSGAIQATFNNSPISAGSAFQGNATGCVLDASTDGTNGTPRTGKNTEPRATATHFYIHVGRVL